MNQLCRFTLFLLSLTLCACSPVNSVAAFDAKQATILLHQLGEMPPTKQDQHHRLYK